MSYVLREIATHHKPKEGKKPTIERHKPLRGLPKDRGTTRARQKRRRKRGPDELETITGKHLL